MPWKAGNKPDKTGRFPIKRADTGEVVGHSATKEKAEASVRARYANSKEFARKHKGKGLSKAQPRSKAKR